MTPQQIHWHLLFLKSQRILKQLKSIFWGQYGLFYFIIFILKSRAREEIDRVLGSRTEITHQDISELKYCSGIFKEALRMYPPSPSVARESTEEIEISGFKIPANTSLMVKKIISTIFYFLSFKKNQIHQISSYLRI